MYILTPESMRNSDQDTIEAGFPEILLMEAAARGTAEYADEIIEREILNLNNYYNRSFEKKKEELKILIFAGKGNNGGDGLAAARFLKQMGYQVEIILSSPKSELRGINETNFNLCNYKNIPYYEYKDLGHDFLVEKMKQSDFLIDALLGTGIKGEVRGSSREIIEVLELTAQKYKKKILAVDIPSGISGRTGEVLGKAVRADYTATMAAYKRGLLLFPGREYSGKVRVIDIGIKEEIIANNSDQLKLITQEYANSLLPKRRRDGHKGSFGRVGILAGSRGMVGAPLLSSDAALRSGSGLVYLLLPEEIEESVSVQLNEVLTKAIPSSDGIFDKKAAADVIEFAEMLDVLAAGPGMNNNPDTEFIISELLSQLEIPLILDADALNSLKDLEKLKKSSAEILLTPHPGEMARLTGKSIAEINRNRIETAADFAAEYGVNIILKGAATVVAAPDGRIFLNNTGTNGMATAGSGDVLTGMVTSLAGQGLGLFDAAVLAVYLHGKAGEFAAAQKSDFALKAGDIVESLADAWNFLIRS